MAVRFIPNMRSVSQMPVSGRRMRFIGGGSVGAMPQAPRQQRNGLPANTTSVWGLRPGTGALDAKNAIYLTTLPGN